MANISPKIEPLIAKLTSLNLTYQFPNRYQSKINLVDIGKWQHSGPKLVQNLFDTLWIAYEVGR